MATTPPDRFEFLVSGNPSGLSSAFSADDGGDELALPLRRSPVLPRAVLLARQPARAVILYRTGDPPRTPPRRPAAWPAAAGNGKAPGALSRHADRAAFLPQRPTSWQCRCGVFNFDGTNYTVVRGFADPASDLDLWQVMRDLSGLRSALHEIRRSRKTDAPDRPRHAARERAFQRQQARGLGLGCRRQRRSAGAPTRQRHLRPRAG